MTSLDVLKQYGMIASLTKIIPIMNDLEPPNCVRHSTEASDGPLGAMIYSRHIPRLFADLILQSTVFCATKPPTMTHMAG